MKRSTMILAVGVLIAMGLAARVGAQQSSQNRVEVNVTPGWDVFPPLQNGSVVIVRAGNSNNFLMTFELKGAEPNQTYTVGFDIFGLPNPGLTSFGVPRFARGTFTREGVTATVDVFPVTTFTTDAAGNGKVHVSPPLSIEDVPAGNYNLQFWWSRGGNFPVYYRTGERHGVGFVVISR